MGHFISPPKRIEGGFNAIFAQTTEADSLAVEYLADHGIDARRLPLTGDLALAGLGGTSEAYVCVPESQVDQAIQLLKSAFQ